MAAHVDEITETIDALGKLMVTTPTPTMSTAVADGKFRYSTIVTAMLQSDPGE